MLFQILPSCLEASHLAVVERALTKAPFLSQDFFYPLSHPVPGQRHIQEESHRPRRRPGGRAPRGAGHAVAASEGILPVLGHRGVCGASSSLWPQRTQNFLHGLSFCKPGSVPASLLPSLPTSFLISEGTLCWAGTPQLLMLI